ncbi:laccase domain-containing protein [Cellulomonas aerilata]|uniref:Laccase domain protein n=1 Tax=Cellulomonas aerilata TaxID=515326 RepID=A0A512DGK3_9CELL|nr:laccase domain-containing protein [Cellulomonas aerilata]GEO35546.1 laccase domain protein [Cellulomonas aerilata]
MTDPATGQVGSPDGPARAGPSGLLVVDLGPGVRAAFTGRRAVPPDATTGRPGVGGNLGLGVGDDPGEVRRRRRDLAAWAGGAVSWTTQVHGTAVALASARPDAAASHPAVGHDGVGPVAEADALVAVGGGAGAAVVVADCVPVLLADPVAGVAAAVHAGRRGLADGVVQAAVHAMGRHGARVSRVRAAVGPAICGACYEVPAALRDEVAAVVPWVASRTSWGTPALDLPAGVVAVLRGLGVEHVQETRLCTYTDDRYFSHRRSGATGEPEGRFAAVVRIAAP